MAEPTGITTNVAPIYSADLLYEQNCKCGTIEVLAGGQEWAAEAGDHVWKIVILNNGSESQGHDTNRVFGSLEALNMSSQSLSTLAATKFSNGQEIMGDFITVGTAELANLTLILYKDCKQS
jgi:hypothetical protein|tara:strand:+ start:4896 stop:5261 length:366 start_codon:yes stop_codon:yes gene_type:complete